MPFVRTGESTDNNRDTKGCRLPNLSKIVCLTHKMADIFQTTFSKKSIFLNENVRLSILISLKFVPNGPIDNKSALVQLMAYYLNQWWIVYRCIYASLGLFEPIAVTWYFMMTSSNGNIFCVTGPLCGELTSHRWIPRTKASNAELWCFLWSAPE